MLKFLFKFRLINSNYIKKILYLFLKKKWLPKINLKKLRKPTPGLFNRPEHDKLEQSGNIGTKVVPFYQPD